MHEPAKWQEAHHVYRQDHFRPFHQM